MIIHYFCFLFLSFQINESAVPDGFLLKDLNVDSKRHLVFATQCQLGLLRGARTWYIDATFKVVSKPFEQLFSIHAFVRKGTTTKQVPLVYVFMSRRTQLDYKAVLQAVVYLIPGEPDVEAFVLDFEKGKIIIIII